MTAESSKEELSSGPAVCSIKEAKSEVRSLADQDFDQKTAGGRSATLLHCLCWTQNGGQNHICSQDGSKQCHLLRQRELDLN